MYYRYTLLSGVVDSIATFSVSGLAKGIAQGESMTMIKLSDSLYVAASQITEVYVNPYSPGLTVVTKDEVRHHYYPQYGEGEYTALERLVAEINAATSKD